MIIAVLTLSSTAKVVPMTPIRYSSAKLKHQNLSRERQANAVHATTSAAVPSYGQKHHFM
jgi:hypothetical protein